MEIWEVDFEFLKIRHYIKDSLNKKELPKMDIILFLIGVQELGIIRTDFSKEEKQDLMHIAVATLLEKDGYFAFEGRDEDGWPHWKKLKAVDIEGVEGQEILLQRNIIDYFSEVIHDSQKDITVVSN